MGLNGIFFKRGVSLLEVVLATAILSIGVAVVIRAFSQCAYAAALAGNITRAVFAAEDVIYGWEQRERTGAVVESQGLVPSKAGGSTSYVITRKSAIGLYQLDLLSFWDQRNTRRTVAFSTYLR